VTQGGGALSATTATTDAGGQAAVQWTLGAAPGANTVSASVAGVGITGSPATFTASGVVAGSQPSVVIVAGNGQTGLQGFAVNVPPAVLVRDAAGAPLAGRSVTFSVASGGGSVQGGSAVTDAGGVATVGGWTVAPGINTLTATVQDPGTILGNPVTFTATGAAPGFHIEVRFVVPTTPSRQAAFTAAAAKWESLIYGDVPDVVLNRTSVCGVTSTVNTVDDILIFAILDSIDGPGKILGQAGPCMVRSGGGVPLVGTMVFDTADVAALEASGQFGLVIEHEMGHVLGYGTIWRSLLVDPASNNSSADPHFVGAQALAAFDRSGGSTYTASAKVPVENTGGPGTVDAHWRESVFKKELMTGFINSGANPLSVVTTASMGDLGYQVNYAGSDPYVVAVAPSVQAGQAFWMGDDILHVPIEVVNAAGRTVGMIPPR
jgi:Leishmanolysin/Bacterial Ig-like domain (group 1)